MDPTLFLLWLSFSIKVMSLRVFQKTLKGADHFSNYSDTPHSKQMLFMKSGLLKKRK